MTLVNDINLYHARRKTTAPDIIETSQYRGQTRNGSPSKSLFLSHYTFLYTRLKMVEASCDCSRNSSTCSRRSCSKISIFNTDVKKNATPVFTLM